ncbi:nuclear transport factor 2 family protein [Vibrio metschnikovii]|jgi:hypothetical protein|nr:nuclear transport factor 2 family protein [Vibrio metschnikovii]EKO3669573.1 nuclear transport factor 2 family protein [Vibrio metschnikovii]EKO3728424.1 nuclear transport factor 2 family protein [Vibrio metschnikovii]
MTDLNNYESDVKKTIEKLIQTASHYDLEALEKIYHDQMEVVMIDPSGQVHTADKASFIEIFQARKEENAPMNTWVEFHHIQADAENGLVVLTRKNNLAGQDMLVNLSIDLKYTDQRWQVTREVIFLHPISN